MVNAFNACQDVSNAVAQELARCVCPFSSWTTQQGIASNVQTSFVCIVPTTPALNVCPQPTLEMITYVTIVHRDAAFVSNRPLVNSVLRDTIWKDSSASPVNLTVRVVREPAGTVLPASKVFIDHTWVALAWYAQHFALIVLTHPPAYPALQECT